MYNWNLAKAIERSGLKKRVIARRIGVHPSVLSKYISGDYKCPTDRKRSIAKILNVRIKELFGGNDV